VPPAQGGTQNQALGRSRGGFSTKIHARTNAEGLPIALLLTPGEAHDSTAFIDLMAEHDVDPRSCWPTRDTTATRNRIERFFNRLKNSRRVATRYDHTARSFLGFAKLAAIKQWISFVHAT